MQLLDQDLLLGARIDEFADSIVPLVSENSTLRTENAGCRARIVEVRAANCEVQKRTEESRRQLALNSSNGTKGR